MINKYYLEIEIRYSIPEDESLNESEYQQTSFNKFMNSELFDVEKDCIDYGNRLIEENLWIEQYPGHTGQRLSRKMGYPLTMHSLKNRAQLFIKVSSLKIHDFENMNIELQKFNITKIKGRI